MDELQYTERERDRKGQIEREREGMKETGRVGTVGRNLETLLHHLCALQLQMKFTV